MEKQEIISILESIKSDIDRIHGDVVFNEDIEKADFKNRLAECEYVQACNFLNLANMSIGKTIEFIRVQYEEH